MKFFRLLFLLLTLNLGAQEGFRLQTDKKTVIPFQLINNLIFIPVNINGVDLTFLLDSGVSETLLFSLENKEVNFKNVEKMTFSGLGGSLEIEGLTSINNRVNIGGNFVDEQHQVYIILDEDFNISSHVGIPVNGIIGYHFFKNHKLKIDYVSKRITVLSEKQFNKENKKYEVLPIHIEGNKPYITADVEQVYERKTSKLLVDLGNSDAIWLFPSLIAGFEYNRPNIDDFLGRGFNGDIFGKRSRIHKFYLGSHTIDKPLAAMPDEYSIQHLRIIPGRKGSVGSETLRRFTLIFDYPENRLFIRKNRNFRDPFHFNMSGLDIKHDGMFWDKDMVEVENPNRRENAGNDKEIFINQNKFQYRFVLKPSYSVAGTRSDSPGYKAGIRKDDKLISINGKKTGDLSLQKINEILRSEEGRHLRFVIERKGREMAFDFYLEDPIPFLE